MHDQDTIAAISTPPGTGAIAIVRISGPKSFSILEKIFSNSPESFKPLRWESRSHEAVHGYIWNPDNAELVDEVVAIPYKGPITYTGEDIVEINCHGSPLLAREILDLIMRSGARLSQHGEFTKRAFLAGRMDLTQAEAVLDLIQARTTRQSRNAVNVLKGQLGHSIKEIRGRLMELLSRLVAGIDFPEEVGELPLDDIGPVVDKAALDLERLRKTARSGRFLRDGLRLSIVGRPNAGKSSLLNQFLAFERAIVTEIPGTTRDSIEEPFDVNGIPVILIDTAGVRITDDKVEKIGIERTGRAIDESDLVLMVCDLTQGWGKEEEEVLQLMKGQPFLLILNKIDQADGENAFKTEIVEQNENCIDHSKISAKTGDGIDELKAKIERFVVQDNTQIESGGSLNQRQDELCLRASKSLDDLKKAIADGMPEDCLATDLKTAIHNLSEACGDEVTEELITEVFSRFCIGK
jgi:tRNA modification GTPase